MTLPPDPSDGWPRGWSEHRRAQATLGLRLSPAERLRWLEENMATLRRWVGRARQEPAPPPARTSDPAGERDDGQ